jgi:DNA gyrase subunit A
VTRAYIEFLEAQLARRLNPTRKPPRPVRSHTTTTAAPTGEIDVIPEVTEPTEPPTTIQIITASAAGLMKRTPRHLYTRQRRGGMGVFDLDAPENDPPALLAVADLAQNLLVLTTDGRAFRLPVASLSEAPVRARGESVAARLNLNPEERLAVVLPEQAEGYLAMLTSRGSVRALRHHVFGEHMRPGAQLFDAKALGALVAACWTPGDADLFLLSRLGKAIRFSERLVPPAGGLGLRLAAGDDAVAIAAVRDHSGVFLLNADGKGTVRLMEGFAANKAPGAGGKAAIAADDLVGAVTVEAGDEIFALSQGGKIIRFLADDVPAKDSVVQGVICMTLRADAPTAVIVSPARYAL